MLDLTYSWCVMKYFFCLKGFIINNLGVHLAINGVSELEAPGDVGVTNQVPQVFLGDLGRQPLGRWSPFVFSPVELPPLQSTLRPMAAR